MTVRALPAALALCAACSFDPSGAPPVDECATGVAACAPGATCADTATGYTCTCPGDRVGDGFTCAIPFASLSVGVEATCGLDRDGYAWCWGSNASGELGDGTAVHRPHPTAVAGQHRWRALATSYLRTNALRDDGTLWQWGSGAFGVGDGTSTASLEPRPAIVGRTWEAIAVGLSHTCALDSAGAIACWGSGGAGQLGNGGFGDSLFPVTVLGGPWIAVAAGGYHTCAIDAAGGLACWGANPSGAIGDGTTLHRAVPTPVVASPPARWRAVYPGDLFTCATRDDGLWCWGAGGAGQLGDGAATARLSPVRVAPGPWAVVAAGRAQACGIADGHLACWGSDEYGAIGDGAPIGGSAPAPVRLGDPPTPWRGLAAGHADHQCALRTDGTAWCWGAGGADQLGLATPFEQPAPTVWPGLAAVGVAVGRYASCAIRGDGSVGCAGLGWSGLRGDGSFVTSSAPSTVPGAWRALAVGDYHACAIDDHRNLACWGGNYAGERGDGTAGVVAAPVMLAGHWARVTAGASFTCAIDDRDDLACWGTDTYGQVGDGGGGQRSTPTFVLFDGQPWRDLAAGTFHACAIDGGGQLWCWGANGSRAIGVGATTMTVPRPTQVSGAPDWQRVAAGLASTCGLRGATAGRGALWCWGDNHAGQAGGGAGVAVVEVPARVGTADDWVDVAVGASHACGVRADGTLWCWGASEWGATALPVAADTPTQVGTDHDWRDVEIGADTTCATRGDGSVWCAGSNRYGQTGRDAAVAAPAPVVGPD